MYAFVAEALGSDALTFWTAQLHVRAIFLSNVVELFNAGHSRRRSALGAMQGGCGGFEFLMCFLSLLQDLQSLFTGEAAFSRKLQLLKPGVGGTRLHLFITCS